MKIDGILLAAGLSRRFGRPKQLILWRGKPLVRHIAEVALASRLRYVVVVLGHAASEVRSALAPLLGDPRLRIVFNAEYEEGQASSIRRGLRALDPDAEAAMFLTCDQPYLTPALLDALLEAFRMHRPLICYPVHEGTRGSPVIFAAPLFPELMGLTGDVGGRVLIEKYRARVHEQEIPSARSLADVDTPEDLRELEDAADPASCAVSEALPRSSVSLRLSEMPLLPFANQELRSEGSRQGPCEEVLIICDGSSRRLPSGERRAAAAALVLRGREMTLWGEYLGAATNQQAEIVAACLGLEALSEPSRVRLLSDSEYVVRTMLGLYKRRANWDFWARLDRARAPHAITWVWTPGHGGHPLHEVCDAAARLISKQEGVDPEKLRALLERRVRREIENRAEGH